MRTSAGPQVGKSEAGDFAPAVALSRVAVVIPVLNEAESLPSLLAALRTVAPGQVIVGDNGSTDGSPQIAREHGCDVAIAPVRGYGAACAAAIEQLAPNCAIVAFLDADGSDDPALLPMLVAPLLADEADLVLGFRDPKLRSARSMSGPQRFGTWLATTLIRWGWGHRFRDMGPFRAIRRDTLARIGMQDRAFGWTIEMQIRAVDLDLRILELPVPYRRRTRGRSKISGTLLGVIRAAYWILRTVGRLYLRRRV